MKRGKSFAGWCQLVERHRNWFVGRELELIGPRGRLKLLVERAHGLATYLIQNGPVLRDGSTFGVSETDQIAVRLCESERFKGLAVISGAVSTIQPAF